MRFKALFLFLALLLLPCLAFADEADGELVINNRILATVNGKSLTVIDVMKKMDVYLARSYPDFARSAKNRYQFFATNWRNTLKQMVENLLIIADAERLDAKIVTDAEIREKIHERHGPNVMASLDQLGITLEEAWEMIYQEMVVHKMTGYRVVNKAMDKVGPQEIKKAYEQYLVANPPKEEWKYRVISIRSATELLGNIYAQQACALLHGDPLSFEELAQKLKDSLNAETEVKLNVSQEYQIEGKDLSDSHKMVLAALQPGTYSEPIPQVSRQDRSIVHRIFYLQEHVVTPAPTFDAMVENLQDEILQREVLKELPHYIERLQKQFNITKDPLEAIPSDFQPFTLR